MNEFSYRFGPETHPSGTVFRLWSPAIDAPRLDLDGTIHAMHPVGGGWHHSDPLPVEPGVRYGFRVSDDILVPDPASRMQDDDVHGYSVLRPGSPPGGGTTKRARAPREWSETVVYELHIGTFSDTGDFRGVIAELPRLRELGITTLEMMPIADFPGRWNWGYDGVLPFAPDRAYGTPDDLAALVAAVHAHDLDIWLDVVYNHFGPEGNYLHLYAPHFFSDSIETPWGAGIDFSRWEVRRFFIENAVYWTRDIGFDGLRLDAVHAIHDPTPPGGVHVLNELAATVRSVQPAGRPVRLVLENDRNEASFLAPTTPERKPDRYDGQWNDDIHHAFHVLLTGERFGYYGGYTDDPEHLLARALATGYVYQGERPPGSGTPRGEASGHLSPTRMISFLQNHDQIGNRAWGERLTSLTEAPALEAATVLHLLTPQIPLLFMGEESGTEHPFRFFCDFDDDLAAAVRIGRRREFDLDDIPDPIAAETVHASRPGAFRESERTRLYRALLALRRRHLAPLLDQIGSGTVVPGGTGFRYAGDPGEDRPVPCVRWSAGEITWCVTFNLTDTTRSGPGGDPVDAVYPEAVPTLKEIPPWTTYVWKEKK
ncbi:MAG: malto-oligosyltrehalose trehalohydrolase [Alkalispirochaeta sp.]